MMYTRYFGFKQIPFETKLDPNQFFYGASARANERSLVDALRYRYSVLFLCGEQGVGKSALLRKLSIDMSRTHRFLFPPREGADIESIIDCLLEAFGLESGARSRTEKIGMLREKIASADTVPVNLVLVVDDAHELSSSSMASLVGLVSEGDGLPFQLLFVGSPGLTAHKEKSWLRKIDQAKVCWNHLKGLSEQEVRSFIQQRLDLAGYRGDPLFSERAIKSVIDYSLGNISKVSVLCGFSLLSASLDNRKVVTEDSVKEQAIHCLLNHENETVDAEVSAGQENRALASPDVTLDHLIPQDVSERYRELGIPKPEAFTEDRRKSRHFRFIRHGLWDRLGRFPVATQYGRFAVAALLLIALALSVGLSGASRLQMPLQSSATTDHVSTKTTEPVERNSKFDRVDENEIAGDSSDGQIQAMLSKAKDQIASQRLFAPKGDNALETYQEIANLVEHQLETLNDLVQIKQLYQNWGHEAEIHRDWVKAEKFYNKASSLAPHDKELTAAIQRVRARQAGSDSSSIETQNRAVGKRDFEVQGRRT